MKRLFLFLLTGVFITSTACILSASGISGDITHGAQLSTVQSALAKLEAGGASTLAASARTYFDRIPEGPERTAALTALDGLVTQWSTAAGLQKEALAADIAAMLQPPPGQMGGNVFNFAAAPTLANNTITYSGTYLMPGETQPVTVTNETVRVTTTLTMADMLSDIMPSLSTTRPDAAATLNATAAAFHGACVEMEPMAHSFAFASADLLAVPQPMAWNPVIKLHEVLERTLTRMNTEGIATPQARETLFKQFGVNQNDANVKITDVNPLTGEAQEHTWAEVQTTHAGNEDALNHYCIRMITRNADGITCKNPVTGEETNLAALDIELSRQVTIAGICREGLAGRFYGDNMKGQTINVRCAKGMKAALENNRLITMAKKSGATVVVIELDVDQLIAWAKEVAARPAEQRKNEINLAVAEDTEAWNSKVTTPEAIDVFTRAGIEIQRVGNLSQHPAPQANGQPVELSSRTGAEGVLTILLNLHFARTETNVIQRDRCIRAAAMMIAEMSGQMTDLGRILLLVRNHDTGALLGIVVLPRAESVTAQRAQEIRLAIEFAVAA